jgi:hypothetical protein
MRLGGYHCPMASQSAVKTKPTTAAEEMRRWVLAHRGRPATEATRDSGVLRIHPVR